jgi:hypothetical protein
MLIMLMLILKAIMCNPMQIPPNSKVALESIKFVRLPVFNVLNDSKRGYWFGESKSPSAGWTYIDTKSSTGSFQLLIII